MAKLYLCTDTRSKQGDFAQFVEDAFAGGVDLIQVREKNLSPKAELEALETVRALATAHQGLVVVNDSPKLAHQFGADVLHLGQDDPDPATGRKALHEWGLIGQSTHSVAQADRAAANPDVDYFCVGPVHATATKPDYEPVGLDLVRHAATKYPPSEESSKPWFAIGGINATNLDEVIEAGARRVVVVRAITEASDPRTAAEELSARLRRAWREDMSSLTFTQTGGGARLRGESSVGESGAADADTESHDKPRRRRGASRWFGRG